MGAFKEMIIDDVEFVDTNLQLFEDDSIQLKLIPEEKDLVHASDILSGVIPLIQIVKHYSRNETLKVGHL